MSDSHTVKPDVPECLAQYRASKCEVLLKSKSKLDEIYLFRISDKLAQIGIAPNDPFTRRNIAKAILFENKQICTNAEPYFPDLYSSSAVETRDAPTVITPEFREKTIEEIYAFYRLRQDTKNYAFLLISAPGEHTKTLTGESLNIEQDTQMRTAQLRKFLATILGEIESADQNVVSEEVVVTDKTILQQKTANFLHETAKKALHAMIVFNGHGNEAGMCLKRDVGCGLNLDDYIKFVHTHWREYLYNEPQDLAARINIVFAQCNGHLHGPAPEPRLTVTDFTNVKKTCTISEIDITNLDISTHEELQQFAIEVSEDLNHIIAFRRVPVDSVHT